MIRGEKIVLRAMETTDVKELYQWENNPAVWWVSDTRFPFSMDVLHKFVSEARNLFTDGQYRFIIATKENQKAVGTLDLFDYDPVYRRVGVGILMGCETERGKGYATEALGLLENYAKHTLQLEQLYADIDAENEPSIRLFEKAGYLRNGIKKNWKKSLETAGDVYFYQRIFYG